MMPIVIAAAIVLIGFLMTIPPHLLSMGKCDNRSYIYTREYSFMQFPCRRAWGEKKIIKSSVVACRFPSCGPFVRVAYRPAAAVPSELPDCVLFSIRLSSRYRSPSFVVGISPPVSKLLVVSHRLPYRWAGRGVGRDGGRDGGRNRRGAEEKPIAEPSDTRVALRSQPTPACQSMHFPKPSSEHVLLE